MNNTCKPEEHDWIELDSWQGHYKCKKCGIIAMTDEEWEKLLKGEITCPKSNAYIHYHTAHIGIQNIDQSGNL